MAELNLNVLEQHMSEMNQRYEKENVDSVEISGKIISSKRTPQFDVVMVSEMDENSGEETRVAYSVGDSSKGDRFVTPEKFQELVESGGDLIQKVNVTIEYKNGDKTQRFKGFGAANSIDLPPKAQSVEQIVGYHYDAIISAFNKEDGSKSFRINKLTHRPDQDRNAQIELASKNGATLKFDD